MTVNSLNDQIVSSTLTTMPTVDRFGTVTCQNCFQLLAPSTAAASYCSREIPWRPANNRRVAIGNSRHAVTSTTAASAVELWYRNDWPDWTSPRDFRIALMSPNWGFNSTYQIRQVT